MKNQKKKEYNQKSRIYILLAEKKRLFVYALLFGVPFALSFVLGWRLRLEGTVFRGSFFLFLLEVVGLSIPAAALAAFILRGRRRKYSETLEHENLREIEKHLSAWRMWFFYGGVIFLCWLPVFLAYYPSVFAYDAEGQLYQVIARDYSTHHPLLHTLFLGAFFRLGVALGSCSAGMAVHSVAQMLLMAGAFGWTLSWLCQRRVSRWLRSLLLLFYGLFPANSVLALSTTKDVLFSALVLLYTVCLYDVVCERNMQMDRMEKAALIALGVLMLLFRNNAVYAFVVCIPVLWICMGRIKTDTRSRGGEHVWEGKKARKTFLYTAFVTLLLFAAASFSLKAFTHAQSGSPREMLSVPLQQMARTRVVAEEGIEPSLRQELEKYIPSEWVFAAYDPHLADPVKNRAVVHDDPAGLIRTWIRLGLKYPAVYVDAFLDNSLGMWFLQDTSHAQVYGIGTESGYGYLSTETRTMPAGFEVVEHSFLPGLRAFMEWIVSDNSYSSLPVIRLLFAPALYWWLLYLYILAALYRKRYRETLPVVFLTAYYLTLLLSPTVLVRYMYPLMVSVPVMIFRLTSRENAEEK